MAIGQKKELTGKEKAAILMISLGPEAASRVYQTLTDEEVESLTYQIASLRNVESVQREQVLEEFHDIAVANEYVMIGGVAYAKEVLERALGSDRANRVFEKLAGSLQVKPFSFAKKLEAPQLLNILQEEHPQTIALVLSYIDPVKSATVLSALPKNVQADVARRIALMQTTSPEAVSEVEQVLEQRVSSTEPVEDTKIGGIDSIVQIINGVDRGTEKAILDSLAERDPKLAEEIKNKLFVFEDIITLDDKTLQRIIRDVDNKDLQVALKGSSDEVKEVIFRNVSQRMAENMQEEMEYMGPVRLHDVEVAQQKIVGVIRDLEEKGEIIVARGGADDVIR